MVNNLKNRNMTYKALKRPQTYRTQANLRKIT